ncbi:MAG TPA: hypothetical protein VJ399_00305 [Patescibacteria group bacterium]|nr:hypothetical protein [Patescibacteria group bacterium]
MYFGFAFLFELIILYYLSRKLTNKIWIIFFKLTKSKKASTYFYSFLFLPGIIFHEISHFLAALFLLVPVGRINLNPTFEEDTKGNIKEIKLGSVEIGKAGLIRGTLVGFAPFIFGITLILLGIGWVISKELLGNWTVVLISIYIIFEIGNTMFLSRSDLKTALELTLVVVVLCLILYLFGIRISLDPQSFLSQSVVDVLKTVDKFLLVPIGLDFILFTFTKIF